MCTCLLVGEAEVDMERACSECEDECEEVEVIQSPYRYKLSKCLSASDSVEVVLAVMIVFKAFPLSLDRLSLQ